MLHRALRGLQFSIGLVALFLPANIIYAEVLDDFYFASPVSFDTGEGPASLVIDDFNGDDTPDIATADRFEHSADCPTGNHTGALGSRF